MIRLNCGHGRLCLTSITNSQSGSLLMHTVSKSCGKSSPAIRQAIRRSEQRRALENLTILRSRPSKLGHGRRSKIAHFSRCLAVTMTGRGPPFSSRCSSGLELEAFSLPGVCEKCGIVVLRNCDAVSGDHRYIPRPDLELRLHFTHCQQGPTKRLYHSCWVQKQKLKPFHRIRKNAFEITTLNR